MRRKPAKVRQEACIVTPYCKRDNTRRSKSLVKGLSLMDFSLAAIFADAGNNALKHW